MAHRHCNSFTRSVAHPRRRRPGRPGPARGRARDAAARGHGPQPPLLPDARRRARAVGLRRPEAARSRRAPGRRRTRRRPLEPRDRLGLPRRRHRLDVAARADRRPAVPQAASEARAARGPADQVRRRRPARVAPGGGRPGDAVQGGQARGHAGRRLRGSRPVALHLAPLLRGGGAQRERAHRVARPLARPGGLGREPAAGALARRPARAHACDRRACRWPRSRGPRSTASGRATCGGRSRSACSRRSERWARLMPVPAIRRSPRRARRPSSPRGCASSSRRSRRRAARSSRRWPTPRATTTSRATSRTWPASWPPGCRSARSRSPAPASTTPTTTSPPTSRRG